MSLEETCILQKFVNGNCNIIVIIKFFTIFVIMSVCCFSIIAFNIPRRRKPVSRQETDIGESWYERRNRLIDDHTSFNDNLVAEKSLSSSVIHGYLCLSRIFLLGFILNFDFSRLLNSIFNVKKAFILLTSTSTFYLTIF